tara:strand:- start:8374 stop:9546 length:1173 start_codon:yes stop_codon:yes gene_type:complete
MKKNSMLQVNHTNCSSTGELLDHSLDTVEFYGFNPLEVTLKQHKPARALKPKATPSFVIPLERKLATLTKSLVAHGLHRGATPQCTYQLENGGTKVASLSLHVVGSTSAIAEGMVLATLTNIARENGLRDYIVHINSVGDKESSARYIRELTTYLRAHLNDLPGYARDEMQSGNIVRAFTKLAEKQHELAGEAPNPMEYLNDESRAHLRNVLEYTENMGIPYELNPTILGSSDCWQHTLFELRIPDDGGNHITFARGGRHDSLAQKTFRVELPVVSVVIEHEIRGRTKPKRRMRVDPKFFFAQLGPQAKMKSFSVLEHLKTSGVPIAQQVALESIGDQLQDAETRSVPYTVIMGHKEALEDTAIVRNMHDRSQVVVTLAQLPGYLKRLKV